MNGDQMSTINMLGLVMCLGGIACHIIHKFSATKTVQSIPIISDGGGGPMAPASCEQQQLQVNYVNGNVVKQNVKLNYFSNQNTPLLDSDAAENSDSDNSREPQNDSEVIFDVLKRRDMRR